MYLLLQERYQSSGVLVLAGASDFPDQVGSRIVEIHLVAVYQDILPSRF